MRDRVVALLSASESKLAEKLREALPGELSVVELESVSNDAKLLSDKLADADIILLSRAGLETHNDFHSWIRSLRPLADLWRLNATEEEPPGPGEKFREQVRIDHFTKQSRQALKERLERRLHQKDLLSEMKIISCSARMGVIAETIERVAATDVSVLVVGPSGSGKELLARAIHEQSPRKDSPFVALNSGAIPEGLIESELFGHEKGSFTGSISKRQGYFSQADGGTIFLDEIGEMKPDMQVKLLRALEEGVFYPLGSERPLQVNVRAIAATNRDLDEAMAVGAFREDLYFRLAGVRIVAPSLAERKEDIVPLLAEFSREGGISGYTSEAIEALESYHWPGNVRQLKNFVARMGAMVGDQEVALDDARRYIDEQGFATHSLPVISARPVDAISPELLYQALISLGSEVKALRELVTESLKKTTDDRSAQAAFRGRVFSFDEESDKASESIEIMEARLMAETLRLTGGNRRKAADRLGIGERTLYRKLKKYHLS